MKDNAITLTRINSLVRKEMHLRRRYLKRAKRCLSKRKVRRIHTKRSASSLISSLPTISIRSLKSLGDICLEALNYQMKKVSKQRLTSYKIQTSETTIWTSLLRLSSERLRTKSSIAPSMESSVKKLSVLSLALRDSSPLSRQSKTVISELPYSRTARRASSISSLQRLRISLKELMQSECISTSSNFLEI